MEGLGSSLTKAYLCGPMTGVPQWNFPLFFSAAEHLRSYGFDIVNPAENDGSTLEEALHNVESRPLGSWEDYLRRDLKNLLECDVVYFLPGWEESRGASLEMHVAGKLGMTLVPYEAVLAIAGIQC